MLRQLHRQPNLLHTRIDRAAGVARDAVSVAAAEGARAQLGLSDQAPHPGDRRRGAPCAPAARENGSRKPAAGVALRTPRQDPPHPLTDDGEFRRPFKRTLRQRHRRCRDRPRAAVAFALNFSRFDDRKRTVSRSNRIEIRNCLANETKTAENLRFHRLSGDQGFKAPRVVSFTFNLGTIVSP